MARPKKNTDTTEEPVVEEVQTIPAAEAATETKVIENPPAPSPEVILPEADRIEMDRYFCVINTSNQASRISQAISHQRDLQMWGVHQYDNNTSRNSFSRSFYFKNRDNAVKALEHANSLLG